jgi:excisionase family DNA binding protein
LSAGFLILPKQIAKVASKPAGEKEMTIHSTHPLAGTWNARNLLTMLEVAEWARVNPKTAYRWIRDGKLEAIQFGPRTFRVPEDAISVFLRKTGYSKAPEVPKPNGNEQP